MGRRHYSTVGNIDLRMLKRQKARLAKIVTGAVQDNMRVQIIAIDGHDVVALQGILHLLDALQDNAQVSAAPGEGQAHNA